MIHNKPLDTQNLTFEQAMKELDTIVRRLEEGQASLDESLALYEHGVALKKFCEEKLEQATLKVDKILQQNGTVSLTSAKHLVE